MENYFREALHNFIFEEAGGGAIRHLADRGYTAKQVADALSFPMPYEKVREAYTKYLIESSVLLKEKPSQHKRQEKTEYVREYDKYGKPSFRRVVVQADEDAGKLPGEKGDIEAWKEIPLPEFLLLYREGMDRIELPAETQHKEAERNIYIACNFGAAQAMEELQGLDKGQMEYVQGICWTKRTMYHLLDKRMLGIAARLQEMEQANGGKSRRENIEKGRKGTVEQAGGYASEGALMGKVYIRH